MYHRIYIIATILLLSISNSISQDSLNLVKDLGKAISSTDSIETIIQHIEEVINSNPQMALPWINKSQKLTYKINDPLLSNKVNYQEAIYYRNIGQRQTKNSINIGMCLQDGL